MNGILETACGFAGFLIFVWTYTQSPLLAIGLIGFHVGVTSYRATRNRLHVEAG